MQRIQQVEGLRFVAVLLVLLFHAHQRIMPSGYLGVDAFFAISGFVITRGVVRSLDASNFSLSSFYVARIARLYPSLMVTICATLLVFSVVYGANDLRDLIRSALASALSVSNIWFWLDSGYFSVSSVYKPLLHTWSLAVEEQFYLVWPVLLMLVWRWKLSLSASIALVGALGFVAALVAATTDPNAAFFLTPFRIHQFAFGAMFAVLNYDRVPHLPTVWLKAIVVLSVVVSVGMAFPTYDAGLPQFAAQSLVAFVVAAGCGAAVLLEMRGETTVLGSAVPVFFGSRSYSIYLVHWPIMLWFFAALSPLSILERIVALVLSIAAGVAMAQLIEHPLRLKGAEDPHRRAKALAAGAFLAATLAIGAVQLATVSARLRDGVDTEAIEDEMRAALTSVCRQTITSEAISLDPLAGCLNGTTTNIVVIGDSKTAAIAAALVSSAGVAVSELSLPGCPPFVSATREPPQACSVLEGNSWEELFRLAETLPNVDGIIVAGNLNAPFLSERDLANLAHWIASRPLPTALVSNAPQFANSVIRLHDTGRIAGNDLELFLDLTYAPDQRERAAFLARLAEPDVVDVFEILCPDACPAYDGKGNILYSDEGHLTASGAALLQQAGVFAPFLERAYAHEDSREKL